MKTVYWCIILPVLHLTMGSYPCISEDLTSTSPEALILVSSLSDANSMEIGTALSEPSESEESGQTLPDPFEPINRAFFHVNDKLYFWVFKPIATGYKAIAPQDVRIGVHNFFSNLSTPIRVANCLLQAKFKRAGNETIRFFLNSSFGLAGLLDPAKKEFKIDKSEADLGQTLGVWGLEPTFYIHWPVIGPSNLRDTIGFAGDRFLDPRTYLLSDLLIVDLSLWSFDKVNETSLTIGEYEELKKAALDPYVAVREAYYQYRQSKIKIK